MPKCRATIFISKLGSHRWEHGRQLTKDWESGLCLLCRERQLIKHDWLPLQVATSKITQSAGGTRADKQLGKKGRYSAAQSKSQPPNCLVQDQAKKRDTLDKISKDRALGGEKKEDNYVANTASQESSANYINVIQISKR